MAKRLFIPVLLSMALSAVEPLHAQQAAPAQSNPCPAAEPASQSSADQGEKKTKKSDQPPASTADAPCPTPVREPSAAEKFPFPGSSSAPAMSGAPAAPPDAPAGGNRPKSAAEEHPFPGSAPPMPGSESGSSSSSSSSDGYSSSSSGDSANPSDTPSEEPKPEPPKTLGRRRLPKVEKLQSDEDRVEEDLKVARFYEGKGDLNAAYMRLRDAVKSLPNDSESHYALARMAEKMQKRDEAIAEYSAYLKLEPDGENVPKAQKAIDQLQTK